MQSRRNDNMSNYQIIKIQPSVILMRNKLTRKIYRYIESVGQIQTPYIESDIVVTPIITETGYLYQAGYMTIANQLLSINRGADRCTFDEQEIVNTVQPIITIICAVHKMGHLHGAITPDNIILNQMGYLKVYYPGIKENSQIFYPVGQAKKEDDFRALALIVLQLLGFPTSKQQDSLKALRYMSKTQKYSEKLIFSLYCMIFQKLNYIDPAIAFFLNNENTADNQRNKLQNGAKQIYDIQILEKNKKNQTIKRAIQKIQFTPPLIKHADKTPIKTIQIAKKHAKGEDAENKKIFQQHKKKKPVEQALKKVSNGKKQSENMVNLQSPSYKRVLRDIRETKQRQDIFKTTLTVKRMRTVSKKKIG